MNTPRQAFEALVKSPYSNLTNRQISILFILTKDQGDHTIRGIAAKLDTPKPIVTRAVDAFESMGFAKRERSPHDGRDVFVRPQEKAFEIVAYIEGKEAAELIGRSFKSYNFLTTGCLRG